jgi:voltage-gated potassium channel
MTVKKRVYEILEGYSSDRPTEITNGVIVSLIGVSVAAFTLGTVDTLYRSAGRLFDLIETVSVLLFTVEYLLRLWSCTSDKRYTASI